MGTLQTWFLKKILKKIVHQVYEKDLISLYDLIHQTAETVYYEDSPENIDAYLFQCFRESCKTDTFMY